LSLPPPVDIPPIQTERLELRSMSIPFMRALVSRDLATAEAEIGAVLPVGFPDHLDAFLAFRLAQLDDDPAIRPWLGRVMVMTEAGIPRGIGSIGFHGPPDADGRVEIGYRVEVGYRRRGLVSEAVAAMFAWARREHGIHRFRASIAPTNEASLAVAAKFGFRQVGVQWDDLDGEELVFELDDPEA
jgi:[ribosomal protein S5]-alanine N-acetyltransferase